MEKGGGSKIENKRQFDKEFHIRPYWHVDAKWIFGILFSFMLLLTVFTYGLYKITERDVAVDISAYAIATSFSPKGLDDVTEINDFKDMIKASEEGYIKPIEGLDIAITLEDLEDKTPEEMRLDIFKRIAEPLYEGSEGLAKMTESEEMINNIESNKGLLAFFTHETNLFFQTQFIAFVFISIIFLALLIFFSYGFGRLVSPAVVALYVGIPNAMFWGIINLVSKDINTVKIPFISESSGSDMLTNSITEIVTNALPKIASIFYRVYGYLIIASGVLFVFVILAKIYTKIKK